MILNGLPSGRLFFAPAAYHAGRPVRAVTVRERWNGTRAGALI